MNADRPPVTVEGISTDVLVVGGGVAGLRAAVAAREAGADVLVCCKSLIGRSGNTVVSTADISAYMPALGVDDSEEIFLGDTMDSGASIANEELVRLLVERSGPALLDLERLGIPLLTSHGLIDRTRAAGHSRARTYRADSTGLGANKGLALSVPLAKRARELGARCLDRTPLVHLQVSRGAVMGAVAINLESNTVLAIAAPAVVLAGGGAGHLFARTNATADAAGDVVAMAMRAGAEARDLEFVQWHPTRMDEPVSLFLSNGLLADGAVFRDASGREFMADYDPRGNLAPRDVLAKAVYTEATMGRGIGGGVYLDCSAIPSERIALRHAHLAQTLQKHGIDFPQQWLVVSPATHFLMGGISIGLDAATSVPGLFAAGEAAGGIHGANRLGGNAFCEGLVFGTIAGESGAAHARAAPGEGRHAPPLPAEALDALREALSPSAADPRPALSSLWQALRRAMWEHVSLVRDAGGLRSASAIIEALAAEAAALRGRTAGEGARILELRAALDCSHAMVAAAAFRQESRGAHWRSDFPETSAAWLGHIAVSWPRERTKPSLEFRPNADCGVRSGD